MCASVRLLARYQFAGSHNSIPVLGETWKCTTILGASGVARGSFLSSITNYVLAVLMTIIKVPAIASIRCPHTCA
jgi:hypothetical protein